MRSPLIVVMSAALPFVLSLAAPGVAQTFEEKLAASPRHQEWVNIPYGDGEEFSAFVVYPESSAASDSVVVIHDIGAMSDWARTVGDELAKHGFLAIVPDFLSGKGVNGGGTETFESRADAGRAMRALDPDELTTRLKAAVAYARAIPSTTDAVSVAGFCWGGSQSFRFATNEPSLKSSFVFYGSPPEKEAMAKIDCPVYGFYAENDNRINATLDFAKETMAGYGKTFEPLLYAGMGHGFVRRGMDEKADDAYKARTQEAWDRWIELLKAK